MVQQSVLDAQQFVASVDLPDLRTHSRKHLGPTPPRFIPEPDADQSVVVGFQLFAFEKGVDETTRRALQNSVLVAQLVANKRTAPDDYEAWYRTYFEVLGRIGWMIQEQNFHSYDSGSAQADVHEAVLQLAAGLMGALRRPLSRLSRRPSALCKSLRRGVLRSRSSGEKRSTIRPRDSKWH